MTVAQKALTVPSSIGNKMKRDQVYQRQKELLNTIKRKAKMRRKKLEEEQPELKKVQSFLFNNYGLS
jgi:hypothetical protein